MSWVDLCEQGQFGHDEFLIVQDVARRVTASHRAHVHELGWLEAPHIELTMEFFAQEGAAEKLTALCEKASDEASFNRLLYRVLDNLFIDLHRKTDAGAAARRIKTLLGDDSRFVEVPEVSRWAVAGLADEMWNGDEAPLLAAAGDFTFTPLEYNTDQRRSPVISNAELLELLEVILEAAGGAVPLSTLVDVVRRRTGLGAVPTFVELTDESDEYDEDNPVLREEAETLAGRLDEREQLLILNYEETVRRKAEILGVSVGTVGNTTKWLKEKLAVYHSGERDPRVLRYVSEILEETVDN